MNDEDAAALGGEQLEPQPPQENAPAQTDAELALETRLVALEHAREGLASAKQERGLRKRFAIGAVLVMIAQIAAADAIFVWYGDTNGWDIPAAAISTWLGATVVQIVAVVLVIMNYLFPKGGLPHGQGS